jgi:hypothetical protein
MKAAFVVRDLNGRLAERAQTSTALTLFLGTVAMAACWPPAER